MKSLLFLIPILGVYMVTAETTESIRNLFAAELFQKLVHTNSHRNVIYSPLSIYNILAIAFMGVGDGSSTANELRHALRFPADWLKMDVAENYYSFMLTENVGPELKMAARIFVNRKVKVVPHFNAVVSKFFRTGAEQVDVDNAEETAEKINTWVEEQTEHKIQKIIQVNSINRNTGVVLVNAIYFKGEWKTRFNKRLTKKEEFRNSVNNKVFVDMMHITEHFQYARLPDLDATALELKYNNSGLSMLIILPNKVDGLQTLERELENRDFNDLTARMSSGLVEVSFPKFTIGYEVDLSEPLKQLGINSMFSDNANFSDLITADSTQDVKRKVSNVLHKAFLKVDEEGCEAAAATALRIHCFPTMPEIAYIFRVDHPFIFAIRSPNAVYFTGHVAAL